MVARCDNTLRDTPSSGSDFLQAAGLAGFYQTTCTMSSDLQSAVAAVVLNDYLSCMWLQYCVESYLIQSHSGRVYNCWI